MDKIHLSHPSVVIMMLNAECKKINNLYLHLRTSDTKGILDQITMILPDA